jgi:hypothetical protein
MQLGFISFIRIAIDPIFPPPEFTKWPGVNYLKYVDNIFLNNKFELIFDEKTDAN